MSSKWLRRGEGSILGLRKEREGGNERPVPPSDPPNSLNIRDTQITAGLWVERSVSVFGEGMGRKNYCKVL